jgi:Ca2+:H+ antiporter
MKKTWFYGLLAASFILSGAAHYMAWPVLAQFLLACLAVLFAAGFLGKATESVAHYAGERIGGFLNGTFGNAAELIIALILLNQAVHGSPRLFEMIKASLTGSIIGNLLLVLGLSALAGGIKFKTQRYNIQAANHSASLMSLAVIALFIPAIFQQGLPARDMGTFSLVVGIVLIIAYILWLIFSMITHKNELSDEAIEEGEALWPKGRSVLYLVIATVMVAFVSEWLVGTLEPIAHQLGLSELFIGAFVVAIVGNAAEHSAAVMLALKNRIGASVEIAVGSSLQIALFVAPVLVIVSFFMGHTMDFVFSIFELAAIAVAVVITKSIITDGLTNWYEGVLLVTVYVILGVAFYLV